LGGAAPETDKHLSRKYRMAQKKTGREDRGIAPVSMDRRKVSNR